MKRYVFLILVLSGLLMWGCGTESKTPVPPPDTTGQTALTPADGDQLISVTGSIQTLNFLESFDTDQLDVVYLVSDPLLTFGKDLQMVPRLAESWEVSADHTEVTFYLQKNATFHDGTPCTAADVVYSYERSLDPEILWGTYRTNFELVKYVRAVDPYTVHVKYTQPVSNPLSSFIDFFIIPKHIYDRPDVPFKDNPANWKPVGTGPYRMVSWEPNVEIVLEANEAYFDGRPHLDRIIFKIVDQNAMTFDMMLNGELDLVPISTMEWQFRTSSERFVSSFQKRKYFLLAFFFTAWNVDNPFFSDPTIRRAMAHFCDRKSFNDTNFFSQYRIATTPVHPESPFFNSDIRPYPFEPDTGDRLLADAGLTDIDGDGILENKDGVPFRFDFLLSASDERAERFAEFYQSSLADHGINMNIVKVDDASYQDRLNDRKFDAYWSGWVTGVDADFLISIFRTPSETESYNNTGYSNPELDALLDNADKELDPDVRKDLYVQAQQIIHEDQPYLFLYYPAALIAVHNRYRALQPSARGIFRWYPGIKDAYVPEPLQQKVTR